MKQYLVLFSVLYCLECTGQTSEYSITIRSSQFFIDGQSNIGKFNCDLYQLFSEGTLKVRSQWSDFKLTFEGMRFRYEVDNFKCSIPTMTRDLQDLLDSDKYPYLYLEVHSIKINKSNTEIEHLTVETEVTITLSGQEKRYLIKNGMVTNYSEEKLTFSGQQVLQMTDFGIEPPTKFFGLVQVTDKLDVEFEIDMLVKKLD